MAGRTDTGPPWTTVARRAWREFLAVPAAVVAAFAVLALVTVYLDQTTLPGVDAVRSAVGHVVSADAAQAVLSGIATGLVTVTSITFSVLLLAVQQTAASLSPVVFDQFLRRRLNQVYLGVFVGLALFAYLVLAAIQKDTPPILGAAVALVLTVVALLFLLLLVYTTVDQMRPMNVIRAIHGHALAARDRERTELLDRTRREPGSDLPSGALYRAPRSGYVSTIDIDRIVDALPEGVPVEVRLLVTIGTYVAAGDPVADVRDDDEARARSLEQAVEGAIAITGLRDIDVDASAAVDEITNIAWTTISSAKHSPEVGFMGLNALRDLVIRWDGERRQPGPEPAPIVYADDDLELALDRIFTLLAAAAEARQPQSAARVLDTYAALLPRLRRETQRLVAHHLGAVPPALSDQLLTPHLDRSLELLAAALGDAGEDAMATCIEDVHARLRSVDRSSSR